MPPLAAVLLACAAGVARAVREASSLKATDSFGPAVAEATQLLSPHSAGPEAGEELWRTLEHTRWVMGGVRFGRGRGQLAGDDDAASTYSEDEYAEGVGMTFRSDGDGRRWCVLSLGGFEQVDFDLDPSEHGESHGFSGVAALEDGAVPIRFAIGEGGRAEAEVGEKRRRHPLRPASIAGIFEMLGGLRRLESEELEEELASTNWACEEDSWHFFFGRGGCDVAHAGHVEHVSLEPARRGESSLFGRGPAWVAELDSPTLEEVPEPHRYAGALFEFYRHTSTSQRLVVEISFGRTSREVLLLTEVQAAAAA